MGVDVSAGPLRASVSAEGGSVNAADAVLADHDSDTVTVQCCFSEAVRQDDFWAGEAADDGRGHSHRRAHERRRRARSSCSWCTHNTHAHKYSIRHCDAVWNRIIHLYVFRSTFLVNYYISDKLLTVEAQSKTLNTC